MSCIATITQFCIRLCILPLKAALWIYSYIFRFLWWCLKYFFKIITELFALLGARFKWVIGIVFENRRKADYDRRLASHNLDSIHDGFVFEDYVAMLLRSNGYSNVEQTKKSGDQGVDILARKDGKKYAIQCKLYRNPVGNKAVQEIVSGRIHYGCNMAIVATNNIFTQSGLELARSTGTILWDREELAKLERRVQPF